MAVEEPTPPAATAAFEQVVEAMARVTYPDPPLDELRMTSDWGLAVRTLQAALSTGLLKLVEERPEDAACSDPNCSYRAEVSLLADECQGSGCRRRGHQPEGRG